MRARAGLLAAVRALVAAGVVLGGCAHRGAGAPVPERPGRFEFRGIVYGDDEGVLVVTTAGEAEVPIGRHLGLRVQLVEDHVSVPGDASGGRPTGTVLRNEPADAITTASLAVGPSGAPEEERVELGVGLDVVGEAGGAPGRLSARVRGSTESDYRSASGTLGGTVELARRNTTLSGWVSFGADVSDPPEPAPAQGSRWPARTWRGSAGLAASQVVHRRAVISGGAALSVARGELASPFRSARVAGDLVPEVLPGSRDRLTAFAQLAWHLGRGTALHLRQGLYLDTWRVWALIPEAGLHVELPRGLLGLRYRFYRQGAAEFYAPSYDEALPVLAGDPRLGTLVAHAAGLSIRGRLVESTSPPGSLTLAGGYDLAVTEFPQLGEGARVVGHTGNVGLIATW